MRCDDGEKPFLTRFFNKLAEELQLPEEGNCDKTKDSDIINIKSEGEKKDEHSR